MIRILSGKLRGRKLKSINSSIVRPTQAKVRKSIMDSIRYFTDKDVLDLFCGTGALGFEALSRGANTVKFVDNNFKVMSLIKENINNLDILERVKLIKLDAMKFLKNDINFYDLIFADPPYDSFTFNDLVPLISKILKKNGLFCYESNKNNKLQLLDNMKIKQYGNTQVILWEKK